MISDVCIYSDFKLSVISEHHNIIKSEKNIREIKFGNKLETISWNIDGDAYIVWPNREGEGFNSSEVFNTLEDLGYINEGLSISYPATASMTAFLITTNKDNKILIFMESDNEGKVRDIRIKCNQNHKITLEITAIQSKWTIIQYSNEEELSKYQKEISMQKIINNQFQLGLFDYQGKTEIPESMGFNVIPYVARKLLEKYPLVNNSIHIFGYGKGHDNFYPDYTPSEKFGSWKKLRKALKETKSLGFETSFYLNGRIIDSEALSMFPQLKDSVLCNLEGNPIKEIYQNRTFYVLDPSSSDWENCLIQWAQLLAECGADTVQLDQLGGRAAVKKTGEIWGEGYNRIIDRIHDLGMKVWIQGVSDYYRADWFEMTFRELDILENGIIRGGNPFGETDLSLMRIFLKNKTFLISESKKKKIKNRDEFNFITDYPDLKGELPLYNEGYLNRLINAEAALR